MIASTTVYKPGDVFFFRNMGWLQRILGILTEEVFDWDQPTMKRAAVCVTGGTIVDAEIVEVGPLGFRIADLARHDGREAVVYRHLSPARALEISTLAGAFLGVGIDRKDVIRQVADTICSDRWWFRRHSFDGLMLRSMLWRQDLPKIKTVHDAHSEIFWSGEWRIFHGQRELRLPVEYPSEIIEGV